VKNVEKARARARERESEREEGKIQMWEIVEVMWNSLKW